LNFKLRIFFHKNSLLFVVVSLAAVQHVTVMQGDPVSLTCFLNNLHHAHVEWKNPEGHILFYNAREAKRDIRIRITTLSQSEFSIRITSVTFKDGGNYTCTQYDDNGAFEQIVEVTVLGKISTVKHGKVNVVKCRVEGNHHPPQISWILSNGPEFSGKFIDSYGHTFVSEGSLGVHHVRNRVMVKCLVHHPALYSPPLLAFIKLGQRRDSDSNMQVGAERTSSLLVLLVTTLIFGLLVVVVFFAIKLRRAHMAWKRGEPNRPGSNLHRLFNTAFTQYVVEEPPIMTSVVNTNAATPKDPAPQQTASRSHIKETSL
uniref:Ig-like domain-containing protein n=1 Tax=Nothobranchius furzeri TaxID=105023 RepID=A0A8C6LXZ3_NOTFU